MKNNICNESKIDRIKNRKQLPIVVIILFIATGVLSFLYFHNWHNMNAFMKERYGKYDSKHKYWVTSDDKAHYVECASQDIKINGEPHCMFAVCGELPEEYRAHADSGFVDIYVLKRSFTGITPVAELTGIESGSFGIPGSVSVIRLGKNFFGFTEESGWSGQGYTNGYMTIYVPTGKSFHQALRFSSGADDSGVCSEDDVNCSPRTHLERTIEFIPKKGSNIYAARITSSGYIEGESISTVHTLTYSPKKHEYIVPKDFTADMGY